MLSKLIITSALWLGLAGAAVAQNADAIFQKHYERLYQLNSKGEYLAAFQEGNQLLNEHGLSDTLHLGYGNLLFVTGTAGYNYGANLDTTLQLLQRALHIFNTLGHKRTADAYMRLGEFHFWYTGAVDQASAYFDLAIERHLKETAVDSAKLSLCWMNKGYVFSYQADFEQALMFFEKAIQLANAPFEKANVYNAIGDVYFQQSIYPRALYYFDLSERQIRLHNGTEETTDLAGVYANKANCYRYMGASAKAITFYKKALTIFEEKLSPDNINTVRLKSYIGTCYADAEQYELGLQTLLPLLKQPFNENKGIRFTVQDKVARCYLKLRQMDAFQNAMLAAAALLDTLPFASDYDKAIAVRNVSLNYSSAEQYDLARKFALQCWQILDRQENREVKTKNYLRMDLGYLNYNLHQPDTAIYYFETALQHLTAPEDIGSIEYYFNLFGSSIAWFQRYQQRADPGDLDKAIERMEESVKMVLRFRNEYVEDADRQFLNHDGYLVFEQLVEMYFEKNRLQPNPVWIEKAFAAAEQNKSILLLESLSSKIIGAQSELADSILYLKQSLYRLQVQSNAALAASDGVRQRFIAKEMFAARQSLDTLLFQMRLQYPRYYQALFQTEVTPLKTLQKDIGAQGRVLVEYVLGEKAVFVFVVRPDTVFFEKVTIERSLDTAVQQFRLGLSGSFVNGQGEGLRLRSSDYQQLYVQNGVWLFQKLVGPIQSYLPKQGKIVLSPGGPLALMPFDALLSEVPGDRNNYKSYPYLLREYQFSYAFSGTLWKTLRERPLNEDAAAAMIAFAPFYEAGDTVSVEQDGARVRFGPFHPLPHTIREIELACKIVGGKPFTGKDATKNRFLEEAGRYRFIHLATHAEADPTQQDFSFLAFYQKEKEGAQGLLFTKDIYGLDLHADLVTLSACETGVGYVDKGEGVMSLARAFIYAGAKSVTTSLWRVNDQKTSELMRLYYENLGNRLPKDEALRQARLQYLEETKSVRYAHPYFWAAFIPIGDMHPIR